MAGKALMAQGGLKNSRSSVSRIEGIAWKPTSAYRLISTPGGTTNDLSMALMPQYKILISTSKGALHRDKLFLTTKSVGERVMSARRPKAKVPVAMERPMMVRNW